MHARIFCLVLLLAVALLPTGCASDEDQQTQLDTYHATPEAAGDDHGWGTSISPIGH